MSMRSLILPLAVVLSGGIGLESATAGAGEPFVGRYFRGTGDTEYLELLDIARRMLDADPEFQNLAMLYTPRWNGFVEGPKWDAWWIQNSYGATFCALPLLEEPYRTFLANANDLWFRFIGDGRPYKAVFGGWEYTPPDGQLCDAATPEGAIHKQGDGRVAIHDFGLEFTAAGLLLQAEALLVSRDEEARRHYLPLLERSANLLETRRDPKNNLFLAGPAANLLAPSYAGWRKPDGTYGQAYLAGLSVTTIAALDRLVELERLAGRTDQARLYAERRDLARRGLPALLTDEGYFIKSLDPDGTRHGVYGAARHGYFEASVNHDAISFGVVDDGQARRIWQKIASIPGLRPHQFIIANYPSLDDMYETTGFFTFGQWVNGGHWSTCEARMILAYCRLGLYDEARRSMQTLLRFARAFRLDNPLTDFGAEVWFRGDPIHLCYDSFGPPAALLRGLFEYQYGADALVLRPRVPPGITRLEQHFPVRFGAKRLFLATAGTGPVTAVEVNGKAWKSFDAGRVVLRYDQVPERAVVRIGLGGAAPPAFVPADPAPRPGPLPADADPVWRPEWPTITTNTLPLRIGADSEGGSRFRGDIRWARLFSRALTEAEVAALAQDKPGRLREDPALVAEWRFDRAVDGTFPATAGAPLAAKIVGKVETVETPKGPAIRLRGEGYLEVAHDPRSDLTRACTLEALVAPEVLGQGGGRILDKSKVGTSNGYLLDTYPKDSLRVIVNAGHLAYDARLAPGEWVHLAATVEPDGRRCLYVNGRRVAVEAKSPDTPYRNLRERAARLDRFMDLMIEAGLGARYETAHAALVVRQMGVMAERRRWLADGTLKLLPAIARVPAEKSYYDAAQRLAEGLERVLAAYEKSADPIEQKVYALWAKVRPPPGNKGN